MSRKKVDNNHDDNVSTNTSSVVKDQKIASLPTTNTDDDSDSHSQSPTNRSNKHYKSSKSQQHQQQQNQQQKQPLLRQASSLLRSIAGSPRYLSVTQSLRRSGTTFSGHVRRIQQFSRQNIVYNWIEPASWGISAIIALWCYHYDIITSLLLLIPLALLFSEFLMVIFSLISIISQHIKSNQNQRLRLTKIHQSSGELSHVDMAHDNELEYDQDDEHTTHNTAIYQQDDKTSSQSHSSRCRNFVSPPQVVRWDIIGVTLSSWFGKVNSIPLPMFMRTPLYRLYSWYFGVNLEEIKEPLQSFRNMQEFFTRELRPGARPITLTSPLISPVDAKLVVCGRVEGDRVEQVKGVTYPLSSFLGDDTWEQIKHKQLYHCVLYLAPGDYHRIHSGVDFTLKALRHFPGTLFPISPIVARLVPNLFALNERVVLSGDWNYGFFSATAVGAYHVGSMAFNFDQSIRTNTIRRDYQNPNLAFLSTRDMGAYAYHFVYDQTPLTFARGDELGTFKLGSTIVLVFEIPDDHEFIFDVPLGNKVQMGQSLGRIIPRAGGSDGKDKTSTNLTAAAAVAADKKA